MTSPSTIGEAPSLAFQALSSMLSGIDSYYGVWRWENDHRTAIAGLCPAERDRLDWERLDRLSMLADRLAERSAA